MLNDEKLSTTLPGVVEKIIKPVALDDTEKAQIVVEGADHLYREIRIENTMKNAQGETVGLREGAQVDVVIIADDSETLKN
jgi:predicted DNA-binding antitoxin AbrB/MazE fold protein